MWWCTLLIPGMATWEAEASEPPEAQYPVRTSYLKVQARDPVSKLKKYLRNGTTKLPSDLCACIYVSYMKGQIRLSVCCGVGVQHSELTIKKRWARTGQQSVAPVLHAFCPQAPSTCYLDHFQQVKPCTAGLRDSACTVVYSVCLFRTD